MVKLSNTIMNRVESIKDVITQVQNTGAETVNIESELNGEQNAKTITLKKCIYKRVLVKQIQNNEARNT